MLDTDSFKSQEERASNALCQLPVKKRERVLVAMSGGVDSSVAAGLLIEQGYDVIGVTMHLWDYSKSEQASCDPTASFDTCCSHEDVADARQVASRLGIPFYVLDYEEDFNKNVVEYFVDEYLQGRTPNPCVACNTFLKFDHLIARAERLRCDYVATGHYAIIDQEESGGFRLRRGVDRQKDQSYFLYSMTQARLEKTLFPLGSLSKSEVRAHAERMGLVNASKKESMEICFIPGNDYAAFIKENASPDKIVKGEVFHADGRKLGDHDGIHGFTIGQRKGLGVAAGSVVYVTDIDPQSGKVIVGPKADLLKAGFEFEGFHTLREVAEGETFDVKIRYRSRPSSGSIQKTKLGTYQFKFDSPQPAVTPGQVAVIYHGDEVVGGGFIGTVLKVGN